MAKFFGSIGFVKTVEKDPGVWIEEETVRTYYGNLTSNRVKWDSNSQINDDFEVTNSVSIIADDFAIENGSRIRWIKLVNNRWKITSIEIAYPRLNLTVGGLYNE